MADLPQRMGFHGFDQAGENVLPGAGGGLEVGQAGSGGRSFALLRMTRWCTAMTGRQIVMAGRQVTPVSYTHLDVYKRQR